MQRKRHDLKQSFRFILLDPLVSLDLAAEKNANGVIMHCEQLFMDARSSDVKFAIAKAPTATTADGAPKTFVRLPAHRIVLAALSPVFKRMFDGGEPFYGPIEVTADTSVDAFVEFLRCFYSSADHLTLANLAAVRRLAASYDVRKIAAHCSLVLRQQPVDGDNVLAILQLAIECGEAAIEAKCLAFVDANRGVSLARLVGCSRATIEALLKHTRLDGYEKTKICIAWTVQACTADGLDESMPSYWQMVRDKLGPLGGYVDVMALTNGQVLALLQRIPCFFSYEQMCELLKRALSENERATVGGEQTPSSERARRPIKRPKRYC